MGNRRKRLCLAGVMAVMALGAGAASAGPSWVGGADAERPELPAIAQRGDIIISELMVDGSGGTGQYIELYNTTTKAVNIKNWVLKGNRNISVTIVRDVTIPPASFVVLGPDRRTGTGIPLDYAYSSTLYMAQNSAYTLVLSQSGTVVDSVTYDPATWPISAASSMGLNPDTMDGLSNDLIENWCPQSTMIVDFEPILGTPGFDNDFCVSGDPDEDGDGYSAVNGDCDDANPDVHPGALEVCDGLDNDCNDLVDDGAAPTWFRDADGDGYGDPNTTAEVCDQPAGYVDNNDDCLDTNAQVNPVAAEACDGVDNNCDGQTDEGFTRVTYYADADGDGYGNATASMAACVQPAGYVTNSTDCDDSSASVHPGAAELCDSIDNNCNGQVDDGATTTWYTDADGDTYGGAVAGQSCTQPTGTVTRGGDCNDSSASVYPGAVEQCNGIDDNCSGVVDEGLSDQTWYADVDKDGYGNPASTKVSCSQPAGYVSNSSDCNDNNANIKPGATEVCDTFDNNCNGQTDEGVQNTYYQDADADGYGNASKTAQGCTPPSGYVSNSTDCNDADAAIKPGAAEVCDGKDNNCNGAADEGVGSTWYRDADGDGYGTAQTTQTACTKPTGYVGVGTDCNDADATVNPGASESCDAKDNNCDGQTDEGVKTNYYVDGDGDGYGKSGSTPTAACSAPTGSVSNNTDCNDSSASVYPGAAEQCNSVDDNCNGQVDEGVTNQTWYRDADGDGYGNTTNTQTACAKPTGYVSVSGDCNDSDATINPGATEACDSKDNNCNGSIDENAGTTYYQDSDNDGYGLASSTKVACSKPAGYATVSGDCNDANAAVNPAAQETCNGIDDDCDAATDDADSSVSGQTTWYRDADGDGFGTSSQTVKACSKPTGYASTSTDCNDADATIKPGAAEVCNGKDDNCSGVVDEGVTTTYYQDSDGDGYGSTVTVAACSKPTGYATAGGDCNDSDATIKPNAAETCNSKDDDCDGQTDEGVGNTYYQDTDGDGYGVSTVTTVGCTKPTGYAAQSGDCNDTNAAIYPTAPEQCNSIDDDCDGAIDDGVTSTTWYRDADSDNYGVSTDTKSACAKPAGYVAQSGDCNDADAAINPGATEACNSKDDDCDGQTDEGLGSTWYRDADGDGYGASTVTTTACAQPAGYVSTGTDCNDADAAIKPGATELCDGKDNNCNGQVDDGVSTSTWYKDTDGDGYGTSATSTTACSQPTGYVSNATDCNDADATIKPGATEVAGDSKDQNCDGAETCFKDADNDGYRPDATSTVASADTDCADANEATNTDPTTDCNDADATIKPGATELCNGKDDDCDGAVDDGVASATWYKDTDGDGYGDVSNSTTACAQPTGYVTNATDCNDADATIKPGATEVAGDSKDQNCDGAETCFKDADNDGYRPDATSTVASTDTDCADANEALSTDPTTDCNDADATIKPGATEQCNSKDDDCDGAVDDGVTNSTWYKDTDGDGYGTSATTTSACAQPTGYVSNASDCNDADATIKPGATEVAGDSKDQNCDGAETCFKDADNDGYRPDATSTVASTDTDCADVNEAVSTDPTTDCNDADATIKPGATELCNSKDDDCDGVVDDGVTSATWYKDTDGDGYGTSATSTTACTQPTGYVTNSTDCNDADATIKPGATEVAGDSKDQNCDGAETCFKDADNDGYRPDATSTVASTDTDCADANEALSTDPTTDCNDADVNINPGAVEQCNSKDDDCDGAVDDGVTNSTWYKDTDGDGYGTSATTTSACAQPTGYVSNSTDCNDADATIKPGATEVAGDSKDQNCDGAETCFKDADNDGYRPDATSTVASTDTDCADANEALSTDPTTDCNDADATIKPGAVEQCNSKDDDCDGVVDDGVTSSTWYKDTDGDGYGTSATTTTACSQPTGYVSNSTDCNDADATIKPGATEVAGDSKDQNCDGAETCFKDADNDGYRPDATSTVASTDTDCADANEALSTDPTTDCNDADATIKPGAVEQCNSKDDDCDGVVDDGVTSSTWYKDTDGDGYGTSATTTSACAQPTGYVSNSTDCNDADATIKPGATEVAGDSKDQNCDGAETCFKDADNDGYRPDATSTVASTDTDCADANEALSTDPTTDCNDADATISPAAVEQCNSKDDDCDGVVDDGVTSSTWYKDTDGDGYGTSATTTTACAQPTGYVSSSTDCNDADATIKPGATEVAGDSKDQNCDGAETCFKDADNDGYRPDATSTVASTDTDCADANEALSTDPTTDCNDSDATIKPGAVETCNSKDDDCDGVVDDGAAATTWYRDVDGDGYGTSATTTTACAQPTGYVSNSTDCNDADATIKPGATEVAGDSKDQNCDGAETCFKDADNDGYRPDATSTVASTDTDCADANEALSTDPTTDCNDADATIKPGATEICNSKDDDCDGAVDDGAAATTWYRDADGDGYGTSATTTTACAQPTGYVSSSTDCNDADATIKPGATEVAGDSKDQNCDGAETCFKDADNDGYRPDATSTVASTDTDCADANEALSTDPTTDCNDADATIKPGATEICNSKDDDCDGAVDDGAAATTWYRDADGDGYGTSATTTTACAQPTGYVSNSTDCNDADATIKPGATETCNAKDDDCDGSVDEGTTGSSYYVDADGDGHGLQGSTAITACTPPAGYATVADDCVDTDKDIYTGAPEMCDTKDNDCNGKRDDKLYSGTLPTGYVAVCGIHYMTPVEGHMAIPTAKAFKVQVDFESINGSTTSAFLSNTSGADGHIANFKGNFYKLDGTKVYTLPTCTWDGSANAKLGTRITCGSVPAGTFVANTDYYFIFTHTQKADGTGWKIQAKGTITTKSPCGVTFNTKNGFKFTKFGSTSSLNLNLMNTAANNNSIQLGATLIDVPKTSTFPINSFKLALGPFEQTTTSGPYTYSGTYGTGTVIPGASITAGGVISLPAGNVAVPSPATSTTVSTMFVYEATMSGTFASSGNITSWTGYTLSGKVTELDMNKFFTDSGNSIGVGYDISAYTPPGGAAQGKAANVTMTATPTSQTMSTAVCP